MSRRVLDLRLVHRSVLIVFTLSPYGEGQSSQRSRTQGVYAFNYQYSSPSYTGVYTCEIPDSRGNTLHFSVVWYSSLPGLHLNKVNVLLFKQILATRVQKTKHVHSGCHHVQYCSVASRTTSKHQSCIPHAFSCVYRVNASKYLACMFSY